MASSEPDGAPPLYVTLTLQVWSHGPQHGGHCHISYTIITSGMNQHQPRTTLSHSVQSAYTPCPSLAQKLHPTLFAMAMIQRIDHVHQAPFWLVVVRLLGNEAQLVCHIK